MAKTRVMAGASVFAATYVTMGIVFQGIVRASVKLSFIPFPSSSVLIAYRLLSFSSKLVIKNYI